MRISSLSGHTVINYLIMSPLVAVTMYLFSTCLTKSFFLAIVGLEALNAVMLYVYLNFYCNSGKYVQ